MILIYESKTGNVKRFLDKIQLKEAGLQILKLSDVVSLSEPFVIVTNTTGFGNAPPMVLEFLEHNADYLRGVAASGNRNWKDSFAKSADVISTIFSVPTLLKFELSGTSKDVNCFYEEFSRLRLALAS
jgi:protein involved in ribonucleotide reduction